MGNVTNEARQGDNQPGQMVRPLTYPFYSLLRKYVSASGLLIVATLAAIIIANSALRELYFQTWQMPVSLSIGSLNLFGHEGQPMSLGAFINDFLMAIFFLSVGLEIKREVLCGELSSLEKALAPVIGACGGMILPVIFFWLICHGNETMERGATETHLVQQQKQQQTCRPLQNIYYKCAHNFLLLTSYISHHTSLLFHHPDQFLQLVDAHLMTLH